MVGKCEVLAEIELGVSQQIVTVQFYKIRVKYLIVFKSANKSYTQLVIQVSNQLVADEEGPRSFLVKYLQLNKR